MLLKAAAELPYPLPLHLKQKVMTRVRAKLKEQKTREPESTVAGRQETVAGAIISRRAADRLRSGYLWVYASDILEIAPPEPEKDLIAVADQRGIFLGTALYSPNSQIALR
ncbi:MAG: hypothetical protein ACRD3S_13060, partial [Terracidiphilus sp.]